MPIQSDDILQELKALQTSLARLLRSGPAVSIGEDDVWPVYARAESLAAVLKFRMGVERPGVFLKLPRSETPETFLDASLDALGRAISELEEKKDLRGALASVRDARTSLRAFLAERRRARMRDKRKRASSAARPRRRAATGSPGGPAAGDDDAAAATSTS